MIRVTATVHSGQIVFAFAPEARFWVLHGLSLTLIETAIRDAVSREMSDPLSSRAIQSASGERKLSARVTEIAQGVLDGLVARGAIEE